MTIMSLKHKIKAIRFDNNKDITKLNEDFKKEVNNIVKATSNNLKQTFDEEITHIMSERGKLKNTIQ